MRRACILLKVLFTKDFCLPPQTPSRSTHANASAARGLACASRTRAFFFGGGCKFPEIGTMWQIGVLAGKPCTFLDHKMGNFGRFGTTKIRRDFPRGLAMKWQVPSTCLDASKVWGFYWNL